MDAARPGAASSAPPRAAHLEDPMLRPRLRRPLLISSVAVLAAQLVIVVAAGASTGGADFPRSRQATPAAALQ